LIEGIASSSGIWLLQAMVFQSSAWRGCFAFYTLP